MVTIVSCSHLQLKQRNNGISGSLPSFLMLLLLESVYLTIYSDFVLFWFGFLLAENGFNFENAEGHQDKVIKITSFQAIKYFKVIAFFTLSFEALLQFPLQRNCMSETQLLTQGQRDKKSL